MKFSWIIVLTMLTITPFGFTPEKSDPVVVVELFTSQGCSSCPSADKLLNEIILQAEKDHKAVIGLSYHVSYWNYLGWKDPYSNEANNTIQQRYAEVLGSSVYTPQMVVNGTEEFVGSDSRLADESIKRASAKAQVYAIVLGETSSKDDQVFIPFTINIEPENAILVAVLTKKHVENLVPRGENRGRLLKHDNVVTYRNEYTSSQKGTITLPSNIAKESDQIVVYVQDKKTLAIVGATIKQL